MDEETDQIIQDFARYVSPGRVKVYESLGFVAVPDRREGAWIYDTEGRRFLNCRSASFNLGHRPAAIIDALKQALERYDIGDHALLSAPRAALARRLAQLMPGDLRFTAFGASGGEVVDLAIKLARAATGRPGVISAAGSFHGHTGLALATGDAAFRAPFEPLAPGFRQIPFGDVAALDAAIDDTTAAVIFETIPVTAGVLIPAPDFYTTARRLCNERGAMLIIDEAQVGLGRTGRLWAFEEWEFVPDAVVVAKGLSGSIYPISALCYRPPMHAIFEKHPFIHNSAFAGTDLGCIVAQATLAEILAPGLLEHVQQRAAQLISGLEELRASYPDLLLDLRARGLMAGVDLPNENLCAMLTMQLVQRGILATFAGNRPSTLLIKPPLIISAEETTLVLEALDSSLQAIRELLAAR